MVTAMLVECLAGCEVYQRDTTVIRQVCIAKAANEFVN
jgi:hypothetical protein